MSRALEGPVSHRTQELRRGERAERVVHQEVTCGQPHQLIPPAIAGKYPCRHVGGLNLGADPGLMVASDTDCGLHREGLHQGSEGMHVKRLAMESLERQRPAVAQNQQGLRRMGGFVGYAQSLQISRLLSASWLRWCTRKQLMHVNSSS